MQKSFISVSIEKEIDRVKEMSKKFNHDLLRKMFSKQIKGSFLIRILSEIQDDKIYKTNYRNWFQEYFGQDMVIPTNDFAIEKEICNYIVGFHNFNTADMLNDDIGALYSDLNYINSLKSYVFKALKLRTLGGYFYRKEELYLGFHFLYYPMILDLFVVTNKMCRHKIDDSALYGLFLNVTQKAWGILAMVDYGILDNGYAMARGMIESYVTLMTLLMFPKGKKKYSDFTDYKIMKTAQDMYTKEFLELYSKVDNTLISKNDYLNYGWYDSIVEFGYIQKNINYSFNFMFKLHNMKKTLIESELLEILYKRCHGFTHGNSFSNKFPIISYIELSQMMYLCLIPLCKSFNIDIVINGVDLHNELKNEFISVGKLKDKLSKMNLDEFYSKKYKS